MNIENETVQSHNPIRTIVRGAYDVQKLRVQMGNRICAQFKAKLGQTPSHSEDEDLDDAAKKILEDLRADFKKMMDGVKTVKLATFKASPLISTFTEFALLQQYLDLEESEKRHFANLGKILLDYKIYTEFLEPIKGIGPAIAGVIISEIDIHKAKYPSSIHQYAGLGVESDGRGTSKRKEHMHKIEYTDKEGKQAERMGIRHNTFLKTKLMGVLASSFMKVGLSTIKEEEKDAEGKVKMKDGKPVMKTVKDSNGNSVINRQKCQPYALIYIDYRHRLQNNPKWAERTRSNIHQAAQRYMIKRFLCDLYNAWRKLEGLPVAPEYAEAKLNIRHGDANKC